MQSFAQDLQFAIRQLRKSPGFACTAIFMVALGICASVSIFGFVDATLIKPLPYAAPSRLVAVFESNASELRNNVSYLDFLDWTHLNRVFSSLDAWNASGFTLSTISGAEQVAGARVSAGFFRTLGVSPVLGRDFDTNDAGKNESYVVLLSYAAWQKRYGGRQDVLGKTVTLHDIPNTIIGVLPRSFQFASAGAAEFWGLLHASDYCEQRRACHNLQTIARLKDGVSMGTALADMQSVAQQLEKQYPESNHDQGANVVSLKEVIVGDLRPILLVLLSGAGLLLLIACFNVASLLVARSDSRKREIAVRGALGAAPARLIRQFATEGLVLVAVGGLLGLVSAAWAVQLLAKLIPGNIMDSMPYLQVLGLNFHVLVFACTISLIAGVLFAITPVLRVSLSNLREGLTEGNRGFAGTTWRRFGSNLVVLELATAMVLLVGAGLLGKSLHRLLHEDIGINPDHLATLQIEGPATSSWKGEQVMARAQDVIDRIGNLPGVKSVGIVSELPVLGGPNSWFGIVGRPAQGDHNLANNRDVSSSYFATLKARLLRGRYFTDVEDASKPPVVIINQTLATRYFHGEDPLGKRIFFGSYGTLSPASPPMEIVGVVSDIKEGPLDANAESSLYLPFNQDPWRGFSVVVRTSLPEGTLLPTLAAAIHKIDPAISVHDEITMRDLINESPSAYLHRSSAWLVGGFAATALLLSLVGLYGVVAYSVGQRTREIGVRMALGAQRSSVSRLILKEAAGLAILGIALGLVGSLTAARVMRGLLFGVQSWDVPTLVAVAAVLGVSALLASYIPARRAAKVDPMVALRYE